MYQSCPISLRRVDSNNVRIISFQVALFAVIILLTGNIFFTVVLFFDFLMRTLRLTHLSPFHLIAKFLLSSWNVTPKLCDEAPKRFALYLGLAISSFLTLFFLIELTTLATFIVIILFICAIFETVFDFCIGCKIYYAIQIVSPWKK
ncbi:MAG TPA: DUF4395 domain-containing protein [Sulfurovum sp.]|nr:DUF4395 domain-containing protein [Sulfurovum sp.]